MKRALVLAGGGARGAFQVGMLQTLVKNKGLDFTIIRGVSVGALNAAILAKAKTDGDSLANLGNAVDELSALWTQEITENKSIYKERTGGYPGLALGADSLYSVEPLKRLIERHVDLDALKGSGRDFKVGTVSLVTGFYGEWDAGASNFLQKLLASTAIPVVFPYVDITSEQDVLVDGGTRNISPLSSAFKTEPNEIYVLLTSRIVPENGELPESTVLANRYEQWVDNWGSKVSGIDVLERAVEILVDEIYLDDLRGAMDWNKVIRSISQAQVDAPDHIKPLFNGIDAVLKSVKKRDVMLHVIGPQKLYGEKNSALDFSPDQIRRAIEHGREVASDPSLWVWSG